MKRKAIFVLLASFLWCMSDTLSAQTANITGKVIDTLGEELPGVSVMVKGTGTGVITGIDGNYSIKAEPSSVLVFTYVGYRNQEVSVGNQKVINITMEEQSQSLDEVVVVAVGYGDVKRRDLTGSIGKANMSDLTKVPVTNVAEALGGRIAGVQVTSSDGALGDNFEIVIRGAGSLTQSTAPLYVIDGFPQETSGLGSLNPNDIESIDVLKDASATAIYGSRGANGVVIITTKKGKLGKPTITYNGSFTTGMVRNTPDVMDGYNFALLQQEVMNAEDFNTNYLQYVNSLEDFRNAKYYDWQDDIFRTAISHNHHVSMNGQQGDLRYSASLSYSNQEGVIINSDLTRYQGRVNLSQKFGKKLKIDFTSNYASTVQMGTTSSTTSSLSASFMHSVWGYRPISPSGVDLRTEMYDDTVNMMEDYRFNPVLSAQNEYRRRITNNLQSNIGVEYELIDNLKLKVTGGYTARDYKSEEFNGSKTRTGNSNPKNTQSKGINAKLSETETRSYLNENTLTYQFNKNKHSMNVLGGITFQKNTTYLHSITAEQITNEAFGMAGIGRGSAAPVVTSSKGENTLMSYLGRFNYNFDSKYYLTASIRADGSSKFPKNNRWGYFPSGSLAWAFGREAFVSENLSWLSNGKLRASWGLTGNNRVGNYDYMAQLTTDNNTRYPWDSNPFVAYIASAMANEKLRWEVTDQVDLGLDLGLFNGRINLTADYYIKTTKDLLLKADIPASSGYSTTMLNVGKLRNRGLELTLETINIRNKTFSWTSSFNIAFNKNEILSLNSLSDQKDMISFVNWDNKYKNMPAYISMIGQPAGQMYGFIYEGTYKYEDFDVTTNSDGSKSYKLKPGIPYYSNVCQPGDPKYKNINSDEDDVINDKDRVAIGNGHPKHIGGFSNNFTYKNFDFNIFFQWSYGNDIYNINRMIYENPAGRKNTNMFASYVNRWTPDNPTSNMPRANAVGSEVYSSLYVEDGSFLKLKSISLGYTLPTNVLRSMRINSARVYVSAENIATFTNYSGPDPEVSTRHSVLTPGFDWSAYPRSFNASVGVSLTF